MKVLSAIGLGIAIVVLKTLMGPVFGAFENTLLSFFNTANAVLSSLGV